jgi:hypothetical protein
MKRHHFIIAACFAFGLMLGGVGLLVVAPRSAAAKWVSDTFGVSPSLFYGSDWDDEDLDDDLSPFDAPRDRNGKSELDDEAAMKLAAAEAAAMADPQALPIGITNIDGEGGTGLQRAVLKNGVWIPVYSPGLTGPGGALARTKVPLTIASPSPTAGRVNQPYHFTPEAIGGTAPYSWRGGALVAGSNFLVNPNTGEITGLSTQAGKIPFKLTVLDDAGAEASAVYALIIKTEVDLAITTATLPAAELDVPATIRFDATGGLAPYQWSLLGTWPEAALLDAATGTVAVTPRQAGEFSLTIMVTDKLDTHVEKTIPWRVANGLDITTPSALSAAIPGAAYETTFTATGGTAPYTWELTRGAFPQAGWTLSPEGRLTGFAPTFNALAEFTLTVKDAENLTYEKSFRLAVSTLLIAQPSLQKVGLAWSPLQVRAFTASQGLQTVGYSVLRDGNVIYQGGGTNFVDRGLAEGTRPIYQLSAQLADGTELPVAEMEVGIQPMSLQRGVAGQRGDPFADRVVAFQPLTPGGYGASTLPGNVTGPPDGQSTFSPAYRATEVASLHAREGAGGAIELEFVDNIVELGPGADLTAFENVMFIGGDANRRFMEPAIVSVALWPGEWHRMPTDVISPADGSPLDLQNPFYYAQGIAGRNATTGGDPTNPLQSGGDSFDLDGAVGIGGLSWIRYIRIQSTGNNAMADDYGGELIQHSNDPALTPLSGRGASGFDLDAVSAVHY